MGDQGWRLYGTRAMIDGRLEWIWKSDDGILLDANLKLFMENIFKNGKIFLLEKKYEVVWSGEKHGEYLVKIGYHLIDHEERDENWPTSLCWGK